MKVMTDSLFREAELARLERYASAYIIQHTIPQDFNTLVVAEYSPNVDPFVPTRRVVLGYCVGHRFTDCEREFIERYFSDKEPYGWRVTTIPNNPVDMVEDDILPEYIDESELISPRASRMRNECYLNELALCYEQLAYLESIQKANKGTRSNDSMIIRWMKVTISVLHELLGY